MARKASISITAGGKGSAIHDRDKAYRTLLTHIAPGGLIQDYSGSDKTYREQIDAIMEPYLKAYNDRQRKKYEEQLELYKAHKRKSKPKLRLKEETGYYDSVMKQLCTNPKNGKLQQRLPYRSLILTFGNVQDRVAPNGISEDEAKLIASSIVKGFEKAFKGFRLLSSVLHADERGAYHLHFAYCVAVERKCWDRGLPIYTGFESGLKAMGYAPEASRYPGRDEYAPSLFQAFRNAILKISHDALQEQGIDLDYGVTLLRAPFKDPHHQWTSQRYKDTIEFMNAVDDLKRQLEALFSQDAFQVTDMESALALILKIKSLAEESGDVQQCARLHGYQVTSLVLERYCQACSAVSVSLYRQAKSLKDSVDDLVKQLEFRQRECHELFAQMDKRLAQERALERKIANLELQVQILTAQEEEQNQRLEAQQAAIPPLLRKKKPKLKNLEEAARAAQKVKEEAELRNEMLIAEKKKTERMLEEYRNFIDIFFEENAESVHTEVSNMANSLSYNYRAKWLEDLRLEHELNVVSDVLIHAKELYATARSAASAVQQKQKELVE